MPLRAGDKLGPYEILAPIGAGGMGEVYKARDARLGRIVAIKTSKAEFSERFESEARAVAALNHPNICQLYDVGPNYLVMEFIEGTPLHGPMTVEKAVGYGAQILDALDAAHRKGFTHRDLKPANLLVTKQGIKLLDFGLAKHHPELRETDSTLTAALTQEGRIAGTLQYMSPEQLHSKQVDGRSDIFSFGCVLYEMLSGRRAFGGSSAASVIAAVLEREPEPLKTTEALDRVIKRCLIKDPDGRFQTARDLKYNLSLALEATPTIASARGYWRLPWIVAVAMGLLAIAIFVLRRPLPATEEVWRFQIPVAGSARLSAYGSFAISPDGRQLAYFASTPDGVSRLLLRSRDSLEARPLPGTESRPSRSTGAPRPPFWSPDSRFIAYGYQGKLKKIDILGDTPQVVCDIPDAATGGSWNRNNVIIFANNNGGIMSVPAAGGTPSVVTVRDSSRSERPHTFPAFLADGRHFVYMRANAPDRAGIYVGSLDTAPRRQPGKQLVASDSAAVFAQSPDSNAGSLLFLRGGMLIAQRLDPARLELVGEPVRVAEQIGSFASFGFFSASTNGGLVYRVTNQNSQLTWFDRQGTVLGVVGEPGVYQSRVFGQSSVSLSPDGTRAAVARQDADGEDIWLFEFARAVSTRLTFGPGLNVSPVWSPDGRRIAFTSLRDGHSGLYQRPSDGTGKEELLWGSDKPMTPTSWSPDGRYLLYTEGALPAQDLWVLPTASDRKPIPYLQTSFFKDHGKVSPDNRWIAYTSGESGQSEVYVQSVESLPPGTTPARPGKWIVSKGGGAKPHWRGDGKELFYSAPDGKVMAVAVTASGTFQPGVPQPIFQGPPSAPLRAGNDATPSWDVTADGRRFLFLVPELDNSRVPFTVVLNWNSKLGK
jgi:serine/threonine protein kinase